VAKNTGRGSSNAHPPLGRGGDWYDRAAQRPLVVWAEPDGVALYDGEKTEASRRWLLTPHEADQLAELLRGAANALRQDTP